MKFKLVALFAVLVLAALTGATTQDTPKIRNKRATSEKQLVCEPVLIYDVSGSTLTGPCHKNLSVYNNGRVSLAEFAAVGAARNESTMINTGEVKSLVGQLSRYRRLQDDQTIVMDIPMTTVTLFDGTTDARAHSFSYWLPTGDYEEVQQTIDLFIHRAFPE